MTALSVTLDEVLAAAAARAASLVPETSGYLALAIGDATARLPFRVEDRKVSLSTEGTVTVGRGTEVLTPAGAAACVRDILARLLACSAGSMPGLAAAARARAELDAGVEGFVVELEAALIPVNRAAARRALARLARETVRARESGRLKRPRRSAATAASPSPAFVAASRSPSPAPARARAAAIADRREARNAAELVDRFDMPAPEATPAGLGAASLAHEPPRGPHGSRAAALPDPLEASLSPVIELAVDEPGLDDVDVQFTATPAPAAVNEPLSAQAPRPVAEEADAEGELEPPVEMRRAHPTPTAIGGYAVEPFEPFEPSDPEPNDATTLDVTTAFHDDATPGSGLDPWGDHLEPAVEATPTAAPRPFTSDVLTAPQRFEVDERPAASPPAAVNAAPVSRSEPAAEPPAAALAAAAPPARAAPPAAPRARAADRRPLRKPDAAPPALRPAEADLAPARLSSVDDLLERFGGDALDEAGVRHVSASLKQMAGLEATPFPAAVRPRPVLEPTPPPPPAAARDAERPADRAAPPAATPRKGRLGLWTALTLLTLIGTAVAWELAPDLLGSLDPSPARADAQR